MSEDTVRRIRDNKTQADDTNDVKQDNDLDDDGDDELMAGTDMDNTLEALLTMPHNALQDATRRCSYTMGPTIWKSKKRCVDKSHVFLCNDPKGAQPVRQRLGQP